MPFSYLGPQLGLFLDSLAGAQLFPKKLALTTSNIKNPKLTLVLISTLFIQFFILSSPHAIHAQTQTSTAALTCKDESASDPTTTTLHYRAAPLTNPNQLNQASNATSVLLPCKENETVPNGQSECRLLKSTCEELKKNTLQLLDCSVRAKIFSFKKGLHRDYLPTGQTAVDPGRAIPVPVCDLSSGEQNQRNCGEPAEVWKQNTRQKILTEHMNLKLKFSEGNKGSFERGAIRGMYPAALNWALAQVSSEIQSGFLRITQPSCQAFGDDIRKQITLAQRLHSQDATFCTKLKTAPDCSQQAYDTQDVRFMNAGAASCYFQAASQQISFGSFPLAAYCEVASRADQGYQRVLNQVGEIYQTIENGSLKNMEQIYRDKLNTALKAAGILSAAGAGGIAIFAATNPAVIATLSRTTGRSSFEQFQKEYPKRVEYFLGKLTEANFPMNGAQPSTLEMEKIWNLGN